MYFSMVLKQAEETDKQNKYLPMEGLIIKINLIATKWLDPIYLHESDLSQSIRNTSMLDFSYCILCNESDGKRTYLTARQCACECSFE